MKKAMLIINPSSGNERAKNYSKLAKEKLESFFDEVEVRYTEKAGDCKMFARESADKRYDSVFVMGGDGTVNEGINGIAEQEYIPNFGFFPLGTVNDLSRALNIALDPEKAIEELDFDRSRKIDIGKINQEYFMNVVAIGVIPEAVNEVESDKKTVFGRFAYFVSGFKKFKNSKSYSFLINADGNSINAQSSLILVGLTNSIGGFEQILPKAKVDDGKLHMIYLKDDNMLDTVKTLPELIKGVEETNDSIGYVVFEKGEINVEDDVVLKTNVDGDEGEELPVELKVLPSHINVYCEKSK